MTRERDKTRVERVLTRTCIARVDVQLCRRQQDVGSFACQANHVEKDFYGGHWKVGCSKELWYSFPELRVLKKFKNILERQNFFSQYYKTFWYLFVQFGFSLTILTKLPDNRAFRNYSITYFENEVGPGVLQFNVQQIYNPQNFHTTKQNRHLISCMRGRAFGILAALVFVEHWT